MRLSRRGFLKGLAGAAVASATIASLPAPAPRAGSVNPRLVWIGGQAASTLGWSGSVGVRGRPLCVEDLEEAFAVIMAAPVVVPSTWVMAPETYAALAGSVSALDGVRLLA